MSNNYITTKVYNFKRIFNQVINPENNPRKTQVVEALFNNVLKIYEEYKDIVPRIPVSKDPYQYHILQPVNGYYELIDFLLNRAISNLEVIEFRENGSNCHSNHLDIQFQSNRYEELSKRKPSNIIAKHQNKTYHHETLHVLQSRFERENAAIIQTKDKNYFIKKVQLFYNNLAEHYKNILNPRQIINANYCRYQPATATTNCFNYNNSLLKEIETEMSAILYTNMHKDSDVEPYKFNDNYIIIVPNYENGYAIDQIFALQLKSLVSKDAYFDSVFFHKSTAIDEFCYRYGNQIISNTNGVVQGQDAKTRLINLFNQLNNEMFSKQAKRSYFTYNLMANIFIEIFKNRIINNIRNLSDIKLQEYKLLFSLSANYSPYEIRNGRTIPSPIALEYQKFYNIVCEEIKRRETRPKTK